MALAQSPNTQKPEFKGLPLPDGNERQVLYQSSFRMVATYAMTLAELDNELRKVLNAKRVIVKVDDRHNFVGKRACHPPLGPSGYLCTASLVAGGQCTSRAAGGQCTSRAACRLRSALPDVPRTSSLAFGGHCSPS